MAGGTSLLLQGQGDGTFSPIRADKSGIVVPGDAKGVALADLNNDAWPDILVGVNNGEMKVFECVPPPGGMVVTVDLEAPDSLKIGSLVTATLSNGKKRTAEVTAGGSYLSQSSRRIRLAVPRNKTIQQVTVRWSDGRLNSVKTSGEESALKIGTSN